jgi:hypothetical protein
MAMQDEIAMVMYQAIGGLLVSLGRRISLVTVPKEV